MLFKKIIILVFLAVDLFIIVNIGLVIIEKIKGDSIKKNEIKIGEVTQIPRNDEFEETGVETELKTDLTESKKSRETQVVSYRNILFQYRDSRPKHVYLVGDFNDWEIGKDKLKRGKNYTWSITYKLAPGTYYYNYVVDDGEREKWILDPYNPKKSDEGPAGKSSVLIVKSKGTNE